MPSTIALACKACSFTARKIITTFIIPIILIWQHKGRDL